jgi:hypothetical protein|tara:strand:+ start:1594 stop:1788 length:195 start_codon:yes stop_codon:yes gene_type:complete
MSDIYKYNNYKEINKLDRSLIETVSNQPIYNVSIKDINDFLNSYNKYLHQTEKETNYAEPMGER